MAEPYRYDCRLFTGYKPCPYDCECADCEHYEPMGPQVLVVRVHQLGNIVKSTPVVHALRKRFDDPWIAWLSSSAAAPLLETNPLVDEVIEYSWEAVPLLAARHFDLVVSLEADAAEAALAQEVPAEEHLGYGVHESGRLRPLGEASLGYFSLSVSDRVRFEENTKTLAELCFDLVGVPYEGEEYILRVTDAELAHARGVLEELGVEPPTETVIALATGGDTARFETKDWPPQRFAELARLLEGRTGARLLLVGGPAERETNRGLASELGETVLDTGCGHSIREFCALLSLCDLVVSADAFPLHAAVAMGTPVVGVFGPTPPAEVAIFGRGRKVVTEMTCGPCYIRTRAECPHEGACMPGISAERVAEAVVEVLEEGE
ncbi:MAG: glycosyltransferase family 9 protein [Armatimonadota bacterium]|nr:glycosyltransferase family 9 protein [Armatimonadota bacterium]